jgi:hypothetical protein
MPRWNGFLRGGGDYVTSELKMQKEKLRSWV